MYHSYSGLSGLLILLTIVLFIFWLIFAAGSFLLGTPVGLLILALLVIRHYWKRSQYLKAMRQAEAEWQRTADFGPFGSNTSANTSQEGSRHAYTAADADSGFEEGVDRSEYSAAEDVHFKEIDE